MRLVPTRVSREVQQGIGVSGAFYRGDAVELLPDLLHKYRGEVQLIYLDPPFATGQNFIFKQRVGEKDHRSGTGSLSLPAYTDCESQGEYLSMMRGVLAGCHELLNDTGTIFLHIDFRMHARLRLMMDEIFGEDNFLNEIIWSYQTGGRARRYFSRKHDVILFYRKSRKYYFDPEPVAMPREGTRRNHMKRHVDTDGRVYRSIKSGGKTYTYYDDETVLPGDVWDDVSHLQQRDPQRTGYDTQKPLALLNRIVLCASREGDLVMDLFAGSGTTLVAAEALGRAFVGVDKGAASMQVIRRRLHGANVTFEAPPFEGNPEVEAALEPGVGFDQIVIRKFQLEPGLMPRLPQGFDGLDAWSVGYFKEGEYRSITSEQRTKDAPALSLSLELPVLDGQPMIRLQDVLGRAFFYAIAGQKDLLSAKEPME